MSRVASPTTASTVAIQPQDLTVTILGTELLHRGEGATAWSGGLVGLLGELGFGTDAARAALSRLARRGFIERAREGRHVDYRLTASARRALLAGEARILGFGRPARPCPGGPAVDAWTIVSFAIPEARRADRDRLRNRLGFAGFGPLHDGVWLAAHERAETVAGLVAELRIGEFVEVFSGRPAGHSDPAALAKRIWPLAELDASYAAFVDESRADTGSALARRARLMHRYRQFPFRDPELPPGLWESTWRPVAIEEFHAQWRALAPAAAREFEERCQR
jgi:phenylacetic acid degradation operon negative regulatory protein